MDIREKINYEEIWEDAMSSDAIPEIDLYMDQILGLIEDRGITKTMINNYSKEKLIKPVKGKKYTKEQILQILCVVNLKSMLSLSSIREIMSQEESSEPLDKSRGKGGSIDFKKVYNQWFDKNGRLEEAISNFLRNEISLEPTMSEKEQLLLLSMMLASCSKFFSDVSEELLFKLTKS